MLTYKYTARNPKTGDKVKSEVQAESEQAASKLIRHEGLAPLEIHLKEDTSRGAAKILHRVKTKDKVIFSRQLSTMINAGLPLVQSLNTVAAQTRNKKLRQIISQVISDVESGSTLSVALARHPHEFNQVFISLVAAGETSGTLDNALERISNQQEKDADIISKVRGALIYPIVVIIVMMAVVVFMLVSVLPQVEELYSGGITGSSEVTLPLLTRVLLAISHLITDYWWLMLISGGVIIFLGTRWFSTVGGKRVADRLKMRMWPIGPLFMKMYMARFARTGTTLVASGVPLIQMLMITADAVDNIHISESIHRSIEKVKGGKSLSSTLEGDPNFLILVPNMLRIGEQSGAIESMLAKTADYYEKEVDNQIKSISTIIEPVLMILLGIVAMLIVGAVLLPIYQLVGKTDL